MEEFIGVYNSRDTRVHHGGGSMEAALCMATGAWEIACEPQAWNREKKLEVAEGLYNPKVCALWYTSTREATLSSFPQTGEESDAQCKIMNLWGTLLTKITSIIKLT